MNPITNMSPATNMNTTNTPTPRIPVIKCINLTIDQSQHAHSLSRMAGLMAPWNVSAETLLAAVYVAVDEVVGGMVRDTRYSCEALVGDDLWSHWPTNGQHRAMGIALSVLVESGCLPLMCVTPRSTNKLYALASSDTVNTWMLHRKSAVEQCDQVSVKVVILIG